jgi:hypothetical protein
MSLTIPNTFIAGTPIVAADVNANFTAVANKFAGGITASDLAAGAGVLATQLAEPYEHMCVNLWTTSTILGAGGLAAADRIIAIYPFPLAAGDPSWTAQSVQWICSDTGTGAGRVAVEYDTIATGGGAETVISTLTTLVLANGAGADDLNQGETAVTTVLARAAIDAQRYLVLRITTADANTMSTGYLSVTVRLRRPITTTAY